MSRYLVTGVAYGHKATQGQYWARRLRKSYRPQWIVVAPSARRASVELSVISAAPGGSQITDNSHPRQRATGANPSGDVALHERPYRAEGGAS